MAQVSAAGMKFVLGINKESGTVTLPPKSPRRLDAETLKGLTAEEQKVLDLFKALNNDSQCKVLDAMEDHLDEEDEKALAAWAVQEEKRIKEEKLKQLKLEDEKREAEAAAKRKVTAEQQEQADRQYDAQRAGTPEAPPRIQMSQEERAQEAEELRRIHELAGQLEQQHQQGSTKNPPPNATLLEEPLAKVSHSSISSLGIDRNPALKRIGEATEGGLAAPKPQDPQGRSRSGTGTGPASAALRPRTQTMEKAPAPLPRTSGTTTTTTTATTATTPVPAPVPVVAAAPQQPVVDRTRNPRLAAMMQSMEMGDKDAKGFFSDVPPSPAVGHLPVQNDKSRNPALERLVAPVVSGAAPTVTLVDRDAEKVALAEKIAADKAKGGDDDVMSVMRSVNKPLK